MGDFPPDIHVLNHTTQDAINGNAPSIRRAENNPIIQIDIYTLKPLARRIIKGNGSKFDKKANFALYLVFIPISIGEI